MRRKRFEISNSTKVLPMKLPTGNGTVRQLSTIAELRGGQNE
jgi:hypothetical protein